MGENNDIRETVNRVPMEPRIAKSPNLLEEKVSDGENWAE
jgi:hypothetical protein